MDPVKEPKETSVITPELSLRISLFPPSEEEP